MCSWHAHRAECKRLLGVPASTGRLRQVPPMRKLDQERLLEGRSAAWVGVPPPNAPQPKHPNRPSHIRAHRGYSERSGALLTSLAKCGHHGLATDCQAPCRILRLELSRIHYARCSQSRELARLSATLALLLGPPSLSLVGGQHGPPRPASHGVSAASHALPRRSVATLRRAGPDGIQRI